MSTIRRLTLAATLLLAAVSTAAASPVLLTFNVHTAEDARALAELDLEHPATYFVSGAFAERHAETARALASRSTIGSLTYDHPDLATLGPAELHRELQLGKLVLEKAIGRPVRWLRAPGLALGPEAVREAVALGFTHDSSEQERWCRQLDMLELPVSNEDGGERLVSDHGLFEVEGMDDDAALAWLVARYDERRALGRPLVLLLHPRIVARHRTVLDRFLAHVETADGELLTADDWVRRVESARPSRFGAWVDFSQGPHDPDLLRRDLVGAGITDVFLQAKDPDGKRYYADPGDGGPVPRTDFDAAVKALAGSGVRVHAWVSANRDPFLATRHPDRAMRDIEGRPSKDWLSPSSPKTVASLVATVRELLDRYDLDGIHLDYLRYPDFDHDFSPAAVEEFRRAEGIPAMPPREMFDRHYNAWMRYRSVRVAAEAAAVAKAIAERHGSRVQLSAALYADAATSYRVMETFGQDYARLATHLSFLVPMAYIHEQRRSIAWIPKVAAAARFRAGDRELFAGLEARQKPGAWGYTPEEFRESLDAAATGWQGQVFYAYSFLFGRGPEASSLPDGSLAELAAFRGRELEPTASDLVSTPQPGTSKGQGFPLSAYVLAGAVFALAATAAGLGRRRRAREAWRSTTTRPPATPGRSTLGAEWTRALALDPQARRASLRSLARSLPPAALDRFRLALLLSTVEMEEVTNVRLGRALVERGLSPHDAVKVLEHAEELGCIELEEGRVKLTPRGRRDLDAARSDGYGEALWSSVEEALAD